MVGRLLLGVCLCSEAMLNVKSLYSTLGVTIYLCSPKNTETIDNPSFGEILKAVHDKVGGGQMQQLKSIVSGVLSG